MKTRRQLRSARTAALSRVERAPALREAEAHLATRGRDAAPDEHGDEPAQPRRAS